MIWWNINKLEHILREGCLPEAEGFTYFMIYNLAYAIFPLALMERSLPNTASIAIVGIAATTTVGFILTLLINRSGDGKNYLERFFSLSTVISVRLSTYVLLFLAFVSVLFGFFLPEVAMHRLLLNAVWYVSVLGFCLVLVFFSMLYNSFKRVSHK